RSHTTELHTFSLHDALPILRRTCCRDCRARSAVGPQTVRHDSVTHTRLVSDRCSSSGASQVFALSTLKTTQSRKSTLGRRWDFRSEDTRLNSSHQIISYAVF